MHPGPVECCFHLDNDSTVPLNEADELAEELVIEDSQPLEYSLLETPPRHLDGHRSGFDIEESYNRGIEADDESDAGYDSGPEEETQIDLAGLSSCAYGTSNLNTDFSNKHAVTPSYPCDFTTFNTCPRHRTESCHCCT